MKANELAAKEGDWIRRVDSKEAYQVWEYCGNLLIGNGKPRHCARVDELEGDWTLLTPSPEAVRYEEITLEKVKLNDFLVVEEKDGAIYPGYGRNYENKPTADWSSPNDSGGFRNSSGGKDRSFIRRIFRIHNLPPLPALPQREPSLPERITDYLTAGGLFNPELAKHDPVRDLLMDCRAALLDKESAE